MAFFRGLAAVSKLRSRVMQEATTLGGVRWMQTQSASDLDLRSQLQELIPEQQILFGELQEREVEFGISDIQLGLTTLEEIAMHTLLRMAMDHSAFPATLTKSLCQPMLS